jgi:hypothetical protein
MYLKYREVLDIFMLADAGRKVHKRRPTFWHAAFHVLDASTENDFDLCSGLPRNCGPRR